jgi:hypothetical protein
MNVFLDTEFTDFYEPCLISMGLASECGADFYAEVPYPDHACSPFVREAILPLLRKIPSSYYSRPNLALEIIKWLEIVCRDKEDVFICVDYQTDWDLFCDALDYRVPPWCHYKLVSNEIIEPMVDDFFKNTQLPEHHALYDAQANRHAFRPITKK